ncbi:MAG: hypothetical protein WDO12_02110 [Pseudomonadota bacterium]
MPIVTLVESVNLALARALADDTDVVVIGEDVGLNGGVFRATAGLQQRFGKLRVQDTPLAEGLIGGMSLGMATQGLKVVAEIQFMGFLYPALDQIANHMARLRHRTRGRLTCPVVIRMPHGGGIHAPEHHSESLEVLLCHHADCAWYARARRPRRMDCCSPRSAIRIRCCSSNQPDCTASPSRTCSTMAWRCHSTRRRWCARAMTSRW